ncbi:hypothetical protein [Lacimicrobium alkaliphilum]|nr:hypothetical protein [Lacimicrobium alkaliphilum]
MKRLLWLILIGSAAVQAQLPKDPTRPPPAQTNSPVAAGQDVQDSNAGMPAVTAIFIGPERRYAIVGGKALYQGEQFRDMEVLEIRAGSVLFRHNDNDIEVALRQDKTLKKGKANGF